MLSASIKTFRKVGGRSIAARQNGACLPTRVSYSRGNKERWNKQEPRKTRRKKQKNLN